METEANRGHRGLIEGMRSGFDRIQLAEALIKTGLGHAVAIADLGSDAEGRAVSRSLVVRARDSAAAESLLRELTRGPLPDFSRPDPRSLHQPTPPGRRGPGSLAASSDVVGPELRFLRSDGIEVSAYLGVFGPSGADAWARARRAALAELARELGPFLDRTRCPRVEAKGSLAVDSRGSVLAADTRAESFLSDRARAARLPVLLRIACAGSAVDGPLDGARLQLRWAQGSLGGVWLGSIWTPRPLDRAFDSLLTPTQREVAGYAAVGATCAEIAQTLGTRVETVRTHIRDIYARLGISTRAELAHRWAPAQEQRAC